MQSNTSESMRAVRELHRPVERVIQILLEGGEDPAEFEPRLKGPLEKLSGKHPLTQAVETAKQVLSLEDFEGKPPEEQIVLLELGLGFLQKTMPVVVARGYTPFTGGGSLVEATVGRAIGALRQGFGSPGQNGSGPGP